MKSKESQSTGRRRCTWLTGGFCALATAILFATGGYVVLQSQIAVSTEVRARKVDSRIAEERATQKGLRVRLVRLKSPARVTRIARDELDMAEPEAVIYLKYERDPSGEMACQSSFEQWSGPPLIREEGEDVDRSPTTSLEPGGALSSR